MAEADCEIIEMRLTGSGLAARLRCPAAIQPAPGQYLLAHLPEADELLSTPLFRMDAYPTDEDTFLAAPPLPPTWSVGGWLRVRGPLGRGFRQINAARALALAADGVPIEPLLPLMHGALDRGGAVTVYSQQPIQGLPLSVEALPFSLLPEALRWADAIALHAAQPVAGQLARWFGLADGQRLPASVEVLLAAPMPCGGRAQCGVCTQAARGGPVLLCRDGPVIPGEDLETR